LAIIGAKVFKLSVVGDAIFSAGRRLCLGRATKSRVQSEHSRRNSTPARALQNNNDE
jgi:hypothetical protein